MTDRILDPDLLAKVATDWADLLPEECEICAGCHAGMASVDPPDDPSPVCHWCAQTLAHTYAVALTRALAENERLRAQPRVHPMAFEAMRLYAEDHATGWVDAALHTRWSIAAVDWRDAGYPLLAEGDAETPVLQAVGGDRE